MEWKLPEAIGFFNMQCICLIKNIGHLSILYFVTIRKQNTKDAKNGTTAAMISSINGFILIFILVYSCGCVCLCESVCAICAYVYLYMVLCVCVCVFVCCVSHVPIECRRGIWLA